MNEETKEVKLKAKSKKETSLEPGNYLFTSNGKSRHMPEGEEYSVDYKEAEILISKGYGSVGEVIKQEG